MGDCRNAMFGWNEQFETSSVADAGQFRPVVVQGEIKTRKKLGNCSVKRTKRVYPQGHTFMPFLVP